MKRCLSIVSLAIPALSCALSIEPWFGPQDIEPWLGNLYEFHFNSYYTYSRYHKVQGAVKPLKHPSNDQLLAFDFGVVPIDSISTYVGIEIADTPRQSFGVRSLSAQARYQLLDDISGLDPISLTAGANFRWVSSNSLKDVSCPYHSNENGEINVSAGKEWSEGPFWKNRLFGFTGVGIANHGSPWTRVIVAFLGNIQNHHRYQVFTEGYWGFGHTERVNIKHFDGYGRIRHQSVDLGAGYGYHTDIWGTFGFDYRFRVFARYFPEYVNFFTFSYCLPFSLF